MVCQREGRVEVLIENKQELVEESALKYHELSQDFIKPSEVAEAILGCHEDGLAGPDGLVAVLLLKIAGKLNWKEAESSVASSLLTLLISLSREKSPVSSAVAEAKLKTSCSRLVDKLCVSGHQVCGSLE